jgi:pectate lyase
VSAPRDVVRLLVWSCFCGCGAGRDVVLGDLPLNDAALGQETSIADGSADPDGSSSPDAGLPETGADAATCPGGSVSAAMRQLLMGAMGFGRGATGGSSGCVYRVTNLEDTGFGSLRDAAERAEPLWIVFETSGNIQLTSPIIMGSHKTVDGRNATITIRNFGFNLGSTTSNVIIENLAFVGNGMGADNDAIKLIDGAHTVWVDHCALSNYGDGLIDITRASTDVTVSWSVFSTNDFVVLLGRHPMDTMDVNIRVTLHHNWWNQTGSYAPRLRFGKAHVLNNLIDRWKSAASAATMGGEIYSEGNVFIAAEDKQALATSAGSDTVRGRAKSIGDWLQNSAVVDQNEQEFVFQPTDFYPYVSERADAILEASIRLQAGVR